MTLRNTWALVLAASAASTIGGLPFNALPVMLGSLAQSRALDAATTGLMGSICFAGYLLGTLGAPFWMERLNARVLTLCSALGTAGAFVASALVPAGAQGAGGQASTGAASASGWSALLDSPSLLALATAWALIGFFASTMTCLGLRLLATQPNRVQAFGVRQGVELSVTAAVLFALPPLVIAHWHYPGAAWALAGVVVLLAVSGLGLPSRLAPPENLASASRPGIALASGAALAMFFVFLLGNIGLWAFLDRMGSALAITPAQAGLVFAVLKLLGGVAAFSVAALGERLSEGWRWGAVLAGLGLGLGLLANAGSFAAFAAGAWCWEFAFTAGCIFLTARIAQTDTSGRAIVLVPAVFAFASMLGPGLAGQLVSPAPGLSAYAPVLALAALCSLVPALAIASLRMMRGS